MENFLAILRKKADLKWHGYFFLKMTTPSANTNNYLPKHQNPDINMSSVSRSSRISVKSQVIIAAQDSQIAVKSVICFTLMVT